MRAAAQVACVILLFAAPSLAETVYLRTDCSNVPASADCFTSTNDLNAWLWHATAQYPTPRYPTAASPVVVDIGVGQFEGHLVCPDNFESDPDLRNGHVTFRGAGRARSILHWPGLPNDASSAIAATNCERLVFRDFSVVSQGKTTFAVFWVDGGSSDWSDVDLRSESTAWYDSYCTGAVSLGTSGTHYFWNSLIQGGFQAYYAACGESWFYGSEIVAAITPETALSVRVVALTVSYRADVRLFGTAVRVHAVDDPNNPSIPGNLAHGVLVGSPADPEFGSPGGNGTLHMHGSLVDVDVTNLAGVDAIALEVTDKGGVGNAFAHTPETAFRIQASPGASQTRTVGDGVILSPFLWPSGADEPVPGLASNTAQDLYVETDCGKDAPGGNWTCVGATNEIHPHLMIRDESCGSNWFDIVSDNCRP